MDIAVKDECGGGVGGAWWWTPGQGSINTAYNGLRSLQSVNKKWVNHRKKQQSIAPPRIIFGHNLPVINIYALYLFREAAGTADYVVINLEINVLLL